MFNLEGALRCGDGGLAQLGERLPCKQEVSGSIPLISTNFPKMVEMGEDRVPRDRKAALDNMPVACCNRRGFSAEKRSR